MASRFGAKWTGFVALSERWTTAGLPTIWMGELLPADALIEFVVWDGLDSITQGSLVEIPLLVPSPSMARFLSVTRLRYAKLASVVVRKRPKVSARTTAIPSNNHSEGWLFSMRPRSVSGHEGPFRQIGLPFLKYSPEPSSIKFARK